MFFSKYDDAQCVICSLVVEDCLILQCRNGGRGWGRQYLTQCLIVAILSPPLLESSELIEDLSRVQRLLILFPKRVSPCLYYSCESIGGACEVLNSMTNRKLLICLRLHNMHEILSEVYKQVSLRKIKLLMLMILATNCKIKSEKNCE